jgi:kinesin family protein 6/9
LAGSERTKKTGSEGITLKEASFINKSLSFLEQVVMALCDRKREHVPYRQSKMTSMLRDSIGGNCKTLMIANVWPEPCHIEETISTLKFATRMMRVSNEAIINVQLDKSLLIKKYEKEIRDLKQELAMHDTLANRGRINYDPYNPTQ